MCAKYKPQCYEWFNQMLLNPFVVLIHDIALKMVMLICNSIVLFFESDNWNISILLHTLISVNQNIIALNLTSKFIKL